MSALRSLLTLYSALDQAVLQSDDPLVAETVDRFLPGSSRNAGWSDEIHGLFFRDEPRLDNIGAGVGEALDGIVNRLSDEPAPSIPMQSRMVYVLGALTHIPAAEAFTENNQRFLDALKVAQPPEAFETESDERAQALFTTLAGNFTGWRDWDEITEMAVREGWLDPLIADVPLCIPAVVTVEGKKCVVIDAILTSNKVTFRNLKNVVDALNWPKAYPSFFCNMQDLGLRADKWRGVLETAGFCYDGSYLLRTPLKYIKSAPSDITACLDYDLIEKDANKAIKLAGDGILWRPPRLHQDPMHLSRLQPECRRGLGPLEESRPRHGIVAIRTGEVPRTCGYAYAAAEMLFGAAEDVKNDPGAPPSVGRRAAEERGGSGEGHGRCSVGRLCAYRRGTTPPPPPQMDAVTKIVEKWKGAVLDLLTKTHLDLTVEVVEQPAQLRRAGQGQRHGRREGGKRPVAPAPRADPAADHPSVRPWPRWRRQGVTCERTQRSVRRVRRGPQRRDQKRHRGDGRGGEARRRRRLRHRCPNQHGPPVCRHGDQGSREAGGDAGQGPYGADGVGHPLGTPIRYTSTAESYDRSIEAIAPWVRVGLPTDTLPIHLIKLPKVLPANASSFRIGLKDYNYIGANYRGQLVLKRAANGTNALADDGPPFTVTAGL